MVPVDMINVTVVGPSDGLPANKEILEITTSNSRRYQHGARVGVRHGKGDSNCTSAIYIYIPVAGYLSLEGSEISIL